VTLPTANRFLERNMIRLPSSRRSPPGPRTASTSPGALYACEAQSQSAHDPRGVLLFSRRRDRQVAIWLSGRADEPVAARGDAGRRTRAGMISRLPSYEVRGDEINSYLIVAHTMDPDGDVRCTWRSDQACIYRDAAIVIPTCRSGPRYAGRQPPACPPSSRRPHTAPGH
jgi:hypothetical protein